MTLTFIYSILKLYGVPRVTKSTTEKSVFMHTTGKTLEESLTFINMRKSSVLIGTKRNFVKLTTQTARWSIAALRAMDGKSKNIIHITIKQASVRHSLAIKAIAHTTMMKLRKESLWTQTSKLLQETERVLPWALYKNIKLSTLSKCLKIHKNYYKLS